MRTPEQVRWDFVQQWLDKAHKDLQAATILCNSNLGDYDNVGFHAQQAAEKFIKALLVRYQVEFPQTHSIAVLKRQGKGATDTTPALAAPRPPSRSSRQSPPALGSSLASLA